MKHILVPILLLVFLSPSLALSQEVTFDDLVEREGLYYRKFTDIPFTGKIRGQPQKTFKNGVLDDPDTLLPESDRLPNKSNQKNENNGNLWIEYHENGQLKSKGNLKNGMLEGAWVGYHENGQLSIKGKYKNGKREGPWVNYSKDGSVHEKYTGFYKGGVKVEPTP